MTDAAVQMSLSGDEILSIHLKGIWQMEADMPSTKAMMEQLDAYPSIKRIAFDSSELGSCDSSLMIFFLEISKLASKKKSPLKRQVRPPVFNNSLNLPRHCPKRKMSDKPSAGRGFSPEWDWM